jgi:hypothetical protein
MEDKSSSNNFTKEHILKKVGNDLVCFVCKFPYTEKELSEAELLYVEVGPLKGTPRLRIHCINCGNTTGTVIPKAKLL